MRSKNQPPKATFESVWASMQEYAQMIKENERERKEYERLLQEQFAEKEREREEEKQRREEEKQQRKKSEQQWEKDRQDFWKSMKSMQRELGGVGNSNGEVAESYFVNSFTKSMEFAGQKYDSIDSGLKRKIKSLNLQGEYDLLLYNCISVVIIEIKYSAEKKHIGWLLEEAAVFKQLFPQYANFDLYLGLAALHFKKGAEKEAKSKGIAIIKQVGDNMVIYDAHLKVFRNAAP